MRLPTSLMDTHAAPSPGFQYLDLWRARVLHCLQEEQERRRQAERDFLELMSSIEGDDGSEAGGGSVADSQQAGGPAALASRRLHQLQVRGWGADACTAVLHPRACKSCCCCCCCCGCDDACCGCSMDGWMDVGMAPIQ